MKKLFICVITISAYLSTTAQVIREGEKYRSNVDISKIKDVREKLVHLAMQNPDYEISDRMVNRSFYELQKAKGGWLGAVSAQYNVNEFSLKQNSGNGVANLYPRYNFGVNVPLDLFTTQRNNVKAARETYMISEAERNKQFRNIRAEVLTRYEDFLMYKTLLDLQVRLTQDEYTTYITKEKDFQENFIDQKEYNQFVRSYNEQLAKQAETQRNYNIAKLRIEEMIGIPIEQVIGTK